MALPVKVLKREVHLVQLLQLASLPWRKSIQVLQNLLIQCEACGDHWPALRSQDWVDLWIPGQTEAKSRDALLLCHNLLHLGFPYFMEKQVCWKTSFQHDKPSTFTLTRWHLLLLSCKWLTTGLNYWNTSSSMRGRGNFHQWWSLSTSGRILIHKNSMAINQTFSVSWCCHRVRVTTTAHRASVASSNAHCENSKIEHYILKLTPIHWIHQNMN